MDRIGRKSTRTARLLWTEIETDLSAREVIDEHVGPSDLDDRSAIELVQVRTWIVGAPVPHAGEG